MTTSSWSTSTATTACDGTSSSTGYPIRGCASITGTIGVYGLNNSASGGTGVYGAGYPGILGQAERTGGIGVKGVDSGNTSSTAGDFECTGTNSTGVYCTSSNGYGLYCNTSGYIHTLSKSSGTFQIDYPMYGLLGKPDTHYLFHGFVESDTAKNVYSGVANLDVKGEFVLEMPEWFSAICGEPSVTVTGMGKRMLTGAEVMGNGKFKLLGDPNSKVSWSISAQRIDAVEQAAWKGTVRAKDASEVGFFLNPTAHGKHATNDHVFPRVREGHKAMMQALADANAQRDAELAGKP